MVSVLARSFRARWDRCRLPGPVLSLLLLRLIEMRWAAPALRKLSGTDVLLQGSECGNVG